MPPRIDQLLIGAVLDVDAVNGQPGDVVGDLVRIVGVAVLDVHADVAVDAPQGVGQAQIGLLVERPPSGFPRLDATPKLVVPIAAKPHSSSARADGTSHALGSNKGSSPWCRSAKVIDRSTA